jgi:uncharacterized repeat protein (TIGR03943 family)
MVLWRPSALLFLIALVLAWEVTSGRVFAYIHDRSVWLLVMCVPVLVCLSLAGAWRAHKQAPTRRYASVIALPLLLAVALPARSLGSAALSVTPASRDSGVLAGLSEPLNLETHGRVWDLKQLGLVQDRQTDLRALDGQRADVLGFVHRPRGGPDNEFVVGRFVVRCCTADAIAFSVPVQYDGSADLVRDSWVEVEGVLSSADRLVLRAESVRIVPTPERPYLQLP